MLAEQRFEFSGLQSERRAALVVVEEEKSDDLALRPEQLDRALRVARPQRARKRAQEGALVDKVEPPLRIEFAASAKARTS